MNARDVAYGYAIGYNDGMGGGKPSEEWTRPSDWPALDVPESNQVTLLFSSLGRAGHTLTLKFRAYSAGSSTQYFSGETSFYVDYGDGNSVGRNLESGYHTWGETYTYQDIGGTVLNNGLQVYPVKITVPNDAYLYFSGGILEAYIGKDIKFYANLGGTETMQHIKTFGWIPNDNNCIAGGAGQFQFMYNLHRFDTTVPFPKIPMSMFTNCRNLSTFDLSECTDIGAFAFHQCYSLKVTDLQKVLQIGNRAFVNCYSLKSIRSNTLLKVESEAFGNCFGLGSIIAPNLAEIGNSAFSSGYALKTVKCSESCVFGTNCFSLCPNLYPRPDGSTN